MSVCKDQKRFEDEMAGISATDFLNDTFGVELGVNNMTILSNNQSGNDFKNPQQNNNNNHINSINNHMQNGIKPLNSNPPASVTSSSSSAATTICSSQRQFLDSQHRYKIVKRVPGPKKEFSKFELRPDDDTDTTQAFLHVYDLWNAADLHYPTGMLINIVDVKPEVIEGKKTFEVKRNKGFVIIEPDILVTITSVMSQLWCSRKSSLGEFFKFPGSAEVMLRGIIAHDLLGRAMLDKMTEEEQLKKLVTECLNAPAIKNAAYSLKLSQKDASQMSTELIPYILDFIKNRFLTQPKEQKFKIKEVLDIEDSYWSPTFGLKGKVDATVKIEYDDGQVKIAPLEFKTGNVNAKKRIRSEHNGQVSLYTLLMRPRYGLEIGDGLLFYIREDELKTVTVKDFELQVIIQLRNRLARSIMTENGYLNNLQRADADFAFKCTNCELKNVCGFLITESALDKSQYTHTETKLWESVKDWECKIKEFFRLWLRVITLEIEEQSKAFKPMDLWKNKVEDREKRGQCIGNLEFVLCSPFEVINGAGQRCFKLTLKRRNTSEYAKKSVLAQGDVVILSTQDEICISYANIEAINDSFITMSIERKLSTPTQESRIRYVVDKIQSTTVLQTQYTYLARLMESTPDAERLRKYICLKNPPKFSKFTGPEVIEMDPFLARYNGDQKGAIIKSLKTDSFLFVKGMPGTGKTDTIIGLLQLLSHKNYKVLVVAYTNNAVDNILLKYQSHNKDFIRVGYPSEIGRNALDKFSTSWMSKNSKDIDDLTAMYNNKNIFGCTLLGLKHEIFQIHSEFDYCIVDEASQALPTVVFGAVRLAKKVIFFGDPDQLPPIIKSKAVRALDIPDNMFSLVAQPVNTVKLTIQYRMNSVIMNLANKLVYKDQMTCANEEQSEAFLNLPTPLLKKYVQALPNYTCQKLMSSILSKKLIKSVVLLDISNWNPPEEKYGESIRNITEAKFIRTCVQSFLLCGCVGSDIGVIAPFRGQVNYLKHLFEEMGLNFQNVEVNTVDQYQGRDKEIIICSFTKSKIPVDSKDGSSDEPSELKISILEDIRRLNVAITRAKKKLILVGNRKTLERFGPFKALFPHLADEQIVKVDSAPEIDQL